MTKQDIRLLRPTPFMDAQGASLTDGLIHFWNQNTAGVIEPDLHGDWDLNEQDAVTRLDNSPQGTFANRITSNLDGYDRANTLPANYYAGFTAMVWGQTQALSSNSNFLMSHGGGIVEGYFQIYGSGGNLVGIVRGNAGSAAFQQVTGPVLSLNTWYCCVLMFDADTAATSFWVNNVNYGSDNTPLGVVNTNAQTLSFGNRVPYAATHKWNGSVWSSGIWDRVLTPDEIEKLWDNGLGLDYTQMQTA